MHNSWSKVTVGIGRLMLAHDSATKQAINEELSYLWQVS